MPFCPDVRNDGDNLRHRGVIADDHRAALIVWIEKLVRILEIPSPHELRKRIQDGEYNTVEYSHPQGVFAHSVAVIILIG